MKLIKYNMHPSCAKKGNSSNFDKEKVPQSLIIIIILYLVFYI